MEAPAWGNGAKRPLSGLSQLRTVSQVHFKEELRPALDYKFPTFYSPDKYPLVDLTGDLPSSQVASTSRITVGSVPSSRPILSSRFSSDWGGIDPAPDGGIKAWSVVVGGFLTYFSTFGRFPHPSTLSQADLVIRTNKMFRLAQLIRHVSDVLSR